MPRQQPIPRLNAVLYIFHLLVKANKTLEGLEVKSPVFKFQIVGIQSWTMEITSEREHLNNFIVGSVPTVFYIPDYITAAEEDQLLNNVKRLGCMIFFSLSGLEFSGYPFLFTCRFIKLRFPSGNLWRIEGYKIGVCQLCVYFGFRYSTHRY